MDVFCVVTARLGEFDKRIEHLPQSVPADYFVYDPPPRADLTSRLEAKIPKCFAWQLYPGYKFYMWIDGNLRLSDEDSLKYFSDNLEDYDVVVLQHPRRDTIWWEYRYNHRGLHNNKPSRYLQSRYINELLDEQMQVIKDDDYVDDLLVNGGIFMYRNTKEVQAMLKEWFYYISRYLIMDQLSWAYVLKKSGLRVNVLPIDFNNCKWLEVSRHAR